MLIYFVRIMNSNNTKQEGKYTKILLLEETIVHKDENRLYKDTIIYSESAPIKDCDTLNKFENMIGVVRKIMDLNGTELDSVAYFNKIIYYGECLPEKNSSYFKRYIEDIYEPKSIKPMTDNDSKEDWFLLLETCEEIKDIEDWIKNNNIQSYKGCPSDEFGGKKRTNIPCAFD